MSKLALRVRPRALVPLELAAHLQLEPARILDVEEVVDVHHCHVGHPRAHHGAVGGAVRGGGGCGRGIQLAGSRDSRRSLTTPPINARTTAVKAAAAGVEEQAASVLVMWCGGGEVVKWWWWCLWWWGPGALLGHSANHITRYTDTDTSPHSSKSLGSKR